MAAFQAFFYVVPALMIALAIFALTGIARRAQDVSRAWNSGFTSQARCLRAYTTTSGGGDSSVRTTLHHVYEFTAQTTARDPLRRGERSGDDRGG
ncbi:hypothetical protein SVIOM74S_02432 [Streptomyces violarus]